MRRRPLATRSWPAHPFSTKVANHRSRGFSWFRRCPPLPAPIPRRRRSLHQGRAADDVRTANETTGCAEPCGVAAVPLA